MNPLEFLKQYFPSGTTEGELHLLDKAFVYERAYSRVVAPPYGSPLLLVGKKGTGKTAIVESLRAAMGRSAVPVVLLKPDDFDTSRLGGAAELATIKRATFAFMTLAVARKLAATIGFASGHKAVLTRAARAFDEGHLDKVQALLQVLLPIGKAVSAIDFKEMLPRGAPKPDEIAAAIRTQLGDLERVAYLVIDDTDQIGSPGEPNYLARLWGLLLGVRQLASECPNLKCIVTMRTEVWRRMKWDARGQRELVDHFAPLVVEWLPDDPQIEAIWRRRLELAAQPGRGLVREFFEEDEVTLPGSEQHRLWKDFLVKNARERPRDVIQLMGKLIDSALRRKGTRITSADVSAVIGDYSRERVDYVVDEFGADCSAMREVISSLADLENVTTSSALLDHLMHLPSSFRVDVRGKTLQPLEREDAFVLWKLLHEAGVENGLVVDSRAERGFRHVNYGDDPGLVSPSRWSELQGVRWEVHPAFRSYLTDVRAARAAAHGMTPAQMLRARRPKS